MKLIDSEMFRVANQSKERRSQGASMWMWRGRVSHCFGALCQPVLDLGGVGGGGDPRCLTQTWGRMLGRGLGCSIWEGQAFKPRVTGSASMLRSINEWPSENGEGGWRDGGRRWEKKMKERRGWGEWQRKNCKALREWRLRPVSPR